MATEFDRHVAETLNVAMPAAEAAAGHALLPSERLEVVGLVRQALLRGDTSSIEALKRRCGAFTETTPPAATLTEAAPTTSAPVAAKRDPAYEKAIRTELLQRCQVGRLLVGRALTAEEQADLEQAIRERAAAAAPVTETTSRTVRRGRYGRPARPSSVAILRPTGRAHGRPDLRGCGHPWVQGRDVGRAGGHAEARGQPGVPPAPHRMGDERTVRGPTSLMTRAFQGPPGRLFGRSYGRSFRLDGESAPCGEPRRCGSPAGPGVLVRKPLSSTRPHCLGDKEQRERN